MRLWWALIVKNGRGLQPGADGEMLRVQGLQEAEL